MVAVWYQAWIPSISLTPSTSTLLNHHIHHSLLMVVPQFNHVNQSKLYQSTIWTNIRVKPRQKAKGISSREAPKLLQSFIPEYILLSRERKHHLWLCKWFVCVAGPTFGFLNSNYTCNSYAQFLEWCERRRLLRRHHLKKCWLGLRCASFNLISWSKWAPVQRKL